MPQSNFRQLQQQNFQQTQQQLQSQAHHLQSQTMIDAQRKFYFEQKNAPFLNPQQIYNLKKSNFKEKKKNNLIIEDGLNGEEYYKTKKQNKKTAKRLFLCFDEFGNIEFSPLFMRRFHWISQVKKN